MLHPGGRIPPEDLGSAELGQILKDFPKTFPPGVSFHALTVARPNQNRAAAGRPAGLEIPDGIPDDHRVFRGDSEGIQQRQDHTRGRLAAVTAGVRQMRTVPDRIDLTAGGSDQPLEPAVDPTEFGFREQAAADAGLIGAHGDAETRGTEVRDGIDGSGQRKKLIDGFDECVGVLIDHAVPIQEYELAHLRRFHLRYNRGATYGIWGTGSKSMAGEKPASADRRCDWCTSDPDYIAYHDQEWGVPVADEQALFERLVLEGMQAGLSWLTILKKRPHMFSRFHDFDPVRLAEATTAEIDEWLEDPGVIRHRGKIEAMVGNARLVADMPGEFAPLLWSFVDGRPRQNAFRTLRAVPSETEASRQMAKTLKKAGFRFVGPTTCYAFMQSAGLVNDHLTSCPAFERCGTIAASWTL